jgi:Cutinase
MWSSAMIPVASAQSCPEAEVVFARGQDEPAGMGMIGDAFVSVLRDRTGKQIGSYAVNYPAANADIAPGVADMTGHIQSMVANCPDIRLVVGGYSLGVASPTKYSSIGCPPERTNTLRLSSRSGMPVGWWVHRCRRVPDIRQDIRRMQSWRPHLFGWRSSAFTLSAPLHHWGEPGRRFRREQAVVSCVIN